MCDSDLLYYNAPGKINLYLKVTGKRPDNYHTIESIFLPLAEPADDIAIACDALPGSVLVGCSDVMLPGGSSNIAGRAAELWAKKSGSVPHWDINIRKNIPVAGGMGGGSSDAAAVLNLLNSNSETPLDAEELKETALALGADVPFFLNPRPTLVTGIGEICRELDFALPELHILLAAPQFPVSAAEGYRLMPPEKISAVSDVLRQEIFAALRTGDAEKLVRLIFNDLQDGVFAKYPILPLAADKIRASGALSVLMTGSGPTLFALYPDRKSLETAQAALSCELSNFRVFAAKIFA